jgi:hypothetical protein
MKIFSIKPILSKHGAQSRRRVLPALLLAAIAVATLAGGALAAGNLVKNGSFEKDGNGDGIPNSWIDGGSAGIFAETRVQPELRRCLFAQGCFRWANQNYPTELLNRRK